MDSQHEGMVIGKTRSICPICGNQVNAKRILRDGEIYLEKTCPNHGDFSTVIWRGPHDFRSWYGNIQPIREDENLGCPSNCGLCGEHLQKTCCVLYEITRRCNLNCSFCFANGGIDEDIPITKIKKDLEEIIKPGQTFLQLSGGEPTMRNDLPEIIAYAKELGCTYIQLNSNGIRIGEDEAFIKECARAGLSFLFMQFDGTNDEINVCLRGKPLLQYKEKAIKNCAKHNIGVILVPTLVPGVNTLDIGNIIAFAIKRVPMVRGVHFQPVSFLGRYPKAPKNEDRYTLGELLSAISKQTNGSISFDNILPSHCDHPLCGFHAGFIAMEEGNLVPLTYPKNKGCCGKTTAAQNREYIGHRWSKPSDDDIDCDSDDFDVFIRQARNRAFTITAMAFQDAYNLDIERLRQCSLHVFEDGKFIPFCARYLTQMEAEK